MQRFENSRQLRRIIRRYVKGTATPAEIEFLEAWDRHTNAGHDFFADIAPEEKEQIGAVTLQRIKAATYLKQRGGYSIRWIRNAAAILIFLSIGIGMYLWYYQNDERQTQLTNRYGDDVLPGGNRATLTLADGSIIPLSEDKEGIIIGNELTYDDGTLISAVISNDEERVGEIALAILSTPNGGQYQLTLPDGTKVWLNASSSLKYPTRFTGNERKVELEGEAFFEVSHNTSMPFIVMTSNQQIRVLGTSFNVSAYGSDLHEITTLVSGSIELAYSGNDGRQHSQKLAPGQQATLQDEKAKINAVDVNEYVSWKDGLYILNDSDLVQLAAKLERWYDVQFDIDPLQRVSVSGVLSRNANLSEVLNAISENKGINFKIEGRRISVLK